MIYPFTCYHCGTRDELDSRPFHPPPAPTCERCGGEMDRVFGCEINTASCRDHSDIPADKRVTDARFDRNGNLRMTRGAAAAVRKERAFHQHIQERRSLLRDGGNRGSFRHTHSVPADLYHGKIRETGDRDYWSDPKNVARHSSCRVDK